MKYDNETRDFLRFTCLRGKQQEELTKRILNDPHDVSHQWYVEIFKDFDWSEYEREKAKSQVSDNSDSGS